MRMATGIFSMVFAGYVYMQAYSVSVDMVKKMNSLMDNAAAELSVANSGNLATPSVSQ